MINTAQLHTLRCYPNNLELDSYGLDQYPSDNDQHQDVVRYNLDQITTRLFNLPLSEFTTANKTTIAKRKINSGYHYQGKILLLLSYYQGSPRLSIEVNGSAFDSLQIDWTHTFAQIDQDYTVTEIHSFIDTDQLPFSQLWKSFRDSSVTSASKRRCDYEGNAKSIYFGSGDKVATIYESGKYHDLENHDIIRTEIRYKGTFARQFWDDFYADQDNLASLVKANLAGTFEIKFRKITKDANVCRRPVLPVWEQFLADTTPCYLKHQPKPSRIDNSFTRTVAYLKKYAQSVDAATYRAMLKQVDRELQASRVQPPEPPLHY